jgi:predicted CoA-binding protein
MTLQAQIERFLSGGPHAVVGASRDRTKYGNKVLRAYLQTNRRVYAINPTADEIEGVATYTALADVPEAVHGVSIITPPEITESIVQQAADLGIRHLWMQPGAESESAIALARQHEIDLIAGGPCLLVVVGYRE